MTPMFSAAAQLNCPTQKVRISNSALSLSVLPERGGRIEELIDRRTGRDWAWHPRGYLPTAEPRELPPGAGFDENWEGGWDDIFPNDAAADFQGFELVDHGELWSRPWQLIEHTDSGMQLSLLCRTVPVSVEKRITLEPYVPALSGQTAARIKLSYSIRNLSDRTLPFLFKLHPAIPVEPGDRILMPRAVLEPVEPSFSSIAGVPGPSEYPFVRNESGGKTRMDLVPSSWEKPQQEFLYSSGLHEPWCGVHNVRTSTTLRIDFNPEEIPFVWLFMSYGLWRGHTVVMPEPCTNKPWDLHSAMARGSCARLAPRETRELEFRVSLIREPLPD